jgi:hypothetical protein
MLLKQSFTTNKDTFSAEYAENVDAIHRTKQSPPLQSAAAGR